MRITLCGSTRFMDAFAEWNTKLTLAGHLVYTVAVGATNALGGAIDEVSKNKLDVVHFGKIDNSDAIFVLDVDGYIGESTRREIFYAQMKQKAVYFLSEESDRNDLIHPCNRPLNSKEELDEIEHVLSNIHDDPNFDGMLNRLSGSGSSNRNDH